MICRIVPAILAKFKVVTISVRTKRSLCCNLTTYNVVSYCVESEVINLIVISCEIKLTSRTVVMSCNTVSFTSGIYLRNPLTVVVSYCVNVSVNVIFSTVANVCSISLLCTSRRCYFSIVSMTQSIYVNLSCIVTSGANFVSIPAHFSTSRIERINVYNIVSKRCLKFNKTAFTDNCFLASRLCIVNRYHNSGVNLCVKTGSDCKPTAVTTMGYTAVL